MDEELTFGQWLRRSRKARDLTQTELAAEVSCAVATIRKLEGDELRPSKDLALRLAAHFGVPASRRATFVAYARGQAEPPETPDLPRDAAALPAAPAQNPEHEAGEPPPPLDLPIGKRPATRRPTNVPVQRELLIGRTQECAAVRQLLRRADVGLVTLTGPGGTGKTRLALQVAADLLDDFPDGVWFVDLAPITDQARVATTVATALGIKEAGGQPLIDSLQVALAGKQVLLVLDNFEQVVAPQRSSPPCSVRHPR